MQIPFGLKREATSKPAASEQGTTGVTHTEHIIPELNWPSVLESQAATF